MDINEIRKQYPMYSDLDDQALVDGFHSKFYSDIPKEEFYQKVNFTTKKEPVKEDESFYERKVPQFLKDAIGGVESVARAIPNLPSMAYGHGLTEVGKYIKDPKLKETYDQLASEQANKFPHIKPFTKSGEVADQLLGDIFRKTVRAPGDAIVAAFTGKGQSGAKEGNIGGDITESILTPLALISGGKAIPKQVASLREAFTKKEIPNNNVQRGVDDLVKEDQQTQPQQKPVTEIENAPPVIPEDFVKQEQPFAFDKDLRPPVLPDQLKPLSEQYPQGIDIGTIEAGGPAQRGATVPELPPMTRDILSLAEEAVQRTPDTERLATRHDIPNETIDFPLRQEVLDELQPKNLEDFGVNTPQEAIGLQPLYEGGKGETRLPIEKTQGINRGSFGQSGAINLEVFNDQINKLKNYVSDDIISSLLSSPKYKDRSRLVLMPVDYFLKSSRDGEAAYKTEEIKTWFGKEKMNNPPTMYIKEDGGTYTQWGHEGRHRARALKAVGIDYIPVKISTSGLRWSEQRDLTSFDFRENYPTHFVTERGKVEEFPIPRAESDLPNAGVYKQSQLGGVGKKQGGAIGFKPTEVSPEDLIKAYKDATGKDLSAERAITKAKELNDQVTDIKNKINAPKLNPTLSKILKSPFTAERTLSPEEAKIALDTGLTKDVDTNFLKKLVNTGARSIGSSYGIRAYYNNPIVEALMRPLSRAADKAKYTSEHTLWGTDGIGTHLNRLTESEMNILWDRMANAASHPEITEAQIFAGLPEHVQNAGKQLRKVYEQDLIIKNKARAAEGKKPLIPEANHIASTWYGDRISVVMDANKEIKAVLTGFKEDIEAGKKWIAENYPDYTITPDAFRGSVSKRYAVDNLAEMYGDILTAAEKGEVSLQEGVLQAMRQARILASERVSGVNVHEKFKKQERVLGAQGYKPWKTRSENAQEGFQAQIDHIEGSITRAELAEAAKTIEEYKKVLGNLNAVKYAESKLRDMQGNGTWDSIKSAENAMRAKLTETQAGSVLLKGYRGLDKATSAGMNLKYFAIDPVFAAINLLELGTKTPVAILHGLKETVAPWAAKKTLETVATLSENPQNAAKLVGDAKYAHEYAMAQNVGNPTVEIASKIRPSNAFETTKDLVKGAVDQSIILPEIATRYTSFTSIFHTLRAVGLEQKHAADLAHDLVKLYFKDYSPLEAPAIFQKLGVIGMHGGRQMRTWVLGEIMANSSAFANKQPLILSTMVGLSALIYGADSVPLFKQMDEAMAWVREIAIRLNDDPELDKVLSSTMTPNEWLFANSGKDPRGLVDKGLDQLGVEGYSLGRTEWRVLPESYLDVLMKAKYMYDAGVSVTTAFKEALKDDPDGSIILKNLIEPAAPKVIPRMIEYKTQRTKEGNILNEKNNLSPSKNISSTPEAAAYVLGSQPKTSGIQKYGERLDKRKMDAISERKQEAREKLVASWNNLQINPDATTRYDNAVKQFLQAYGGANSTDASMRRTLEEAAKEMKWSPQQLKKLETIKNAKNNMELVQFFKEVTGKPVKRDQK